MEQQPQLRLVRVACDIIAEFGDQLWMTEDGVIVGVCRKEESSITPTKKVTTSEVVISITDSMYLTIIPTMPLPTTAANIHRAVCIHIGIGSEIPSYHRTHGRLNKLVRNGKLISYKVPGKANKHYRLANQGADLLSSIGKQQIA